MTASRDLPEIKEHYSREEVFEVLEGLQDVTPSAGWIKALFEETNFVSVLQELKEASLAELKHDEGITKEALAQITSSLNISVNAVKDLALSTDSDEIKLQAIDRILEELNKTQDRQEKVNRSNQKYKIPFGVIAFGCAVIIGTLAGLFKQNRSKRRNGAA